ncbi:MAG: hypothetical protein NT155_01375 [Candidatus Staskawiczbacteria bacterium]|nr:hypothetical protein [Candidatus Staskawiczbacteria bacterium]
MNIFTKSLALIARIIVLGLVAYLSGGIFFVQNKTQLGIGIFIWIFITLPTIFAIFFKKNFIEKHPKFAKPWKILFVFCAIIFILYVAFWIFGMWHIAEKERTQRAIDFINSQKITMDDVMGKNLPPAPDQKLNDSTLAGIDTNKNYIRDDVELAIFKKYPDSAKIRAAELQYAQALQLELTQVSNSETLVPAMQKEGSAYQCFGLSIMSESMAALSAVTILDQKDKEVTNLVLNTDLRKKTYSDAYKKYMTSYSSLSGNKCDIAF